MKKYYQEDLAFVHDQGHGQLAIDAAKALLYQLKKQGIKNGLVIDLGCGSGILAGELVAHNYKVIGIDFSEALLKIARQRVPAADFIHASFLDYNLPSCQVVTAIGEVFNYLFDPQNNLENLNNLFQKIYESLEEKGLFCFDLIGPGILNDKAHEQRFIETAEWDIFLDYYEDSQENILTRKIKLYRKLDHQLYRKSEETHLVRLYQPEQIQKMLELVGFKVEVHDKYHELNLRHGHYNFFARKL